MSINGTDVGVVMETERVTPLNNDTFLPDTGWPAWRGLVLEEDHALKTKLSGLTVTDINDPSSRPRRVDVWFRMPEQELRTKTFPHILIDFLDISVEHDREHQGVVRYYTEANTGNILQGGPVDGYFPVPMRLTYQITTSTRSAQHDRQLLGALLMDDRLHPRYGFLETPSGTIRRLDILEGPRDSSTLADDGKRLFRKVWTVAVSSEIVPDLDLALANSTRVQSVILALKNGATPSTAVPIS